MKTPPRIRERELEPAYLSIDAMQIDEVLRLNYEQSPSVASLYRRFQLNPKKRYRTTCHENETIIHRYA